MDPETNNQMSELMALTRENNKILRKMRRSAMWASVGRVIWWGFIIGSTTIAYFYLQPVLGTLMDTYGQILKATGALEKAGTGIQQNLQNFLN